MGGAGKGKGKGKGGNFAQIMKGHFQIMLGGDWKDYGAEEDRILKQAFLVGQPNARFSLRGQAYDYSFAHMSQKNMQSGKERKIRPPYGMKPPSAPIMPQGDVIVVSVPQGVPSVEINDPNNPGRKITVAIPPGAAKGARMVVPVPAKGENIEAVVEKQKKHGMSTGSKVAIGAAAVGALAVGGVVLGDHLSDGAISDWAAPGLDAAGDWVGTAAEDAGDWIGTAAEDAGDWVGDAAEDVVDWGGDAAEDVGDFVMSLF